MKAPIILRVFRENQLVEVKQFEVDQIVIGHNADVQLDLDGEGVSTIHCLVELRDSGYYICDLGSQTGTFKNGQAILDEPIASGDEVRVGPFRIVFFIGVPKPKAIPVSGEEKPKMAAVPPVMPVVVPVPESSAKPVAPVAEKPSHVESRPTIPQRPPADEEENKSAAPIVKQPKKDAKPAAIVAARPEIRRNTADFAKPRTSSTFAPPSEIKDLRDHLKPGKGSVVEVVVAWRERILETYHFRERGVYKVGRNQEAIRVSADAVPGNWSMLEISTAVKVNVPDSMDFELVTSQERKSMADCQASGKANRAGTSSGVRLDQNEMIWIGLGEINLYIRFVPQTAVVPLLPPLGLTVTELSGLVMSIVLVALLAFYISATTPKSLQENPNDQITRTAQVIFNTPPPQPNPPPLPQTPEQPPTPPPTTTAPKPSKAQASDNKQQDQKKGAANNLAAANNSNAGRAAEVAPKPDSKNRPKKFTSTKQGAAVKIGEKAGSNAASAKDVSKVGLFSAFSGGGVRQKLDQAYSGAGEVLGQADQATGATGFGENRAGDDLGSKFKDTGAGGKGTATQGIAGIGTKGRGSGQTTYGATDGLGDKSSVLIEPGGAEEDFIGTIDKEAVRRRVRHYLHEIRGCYVRELNRLERGQRLEGKVVVAWEIVAKGAARNVRIKSSTLGSPAVENCIRDRLASWSFPEPPVGMTAEVAYPFYLRPEN